MESYELDSEKIIEWAVSHADYIELEKVAKGVYGIYVQRRKNDYPEEQRENRKLRRQFTSSGEYSKKKSKKNNYENQQLWRTKVTNYGNVKYEPASGPVRIIKPARKKK